MEQHKWIQLADFVAGCLQEWERAQEPTYHLVEHKFRSVSKKHWREIKAIWVAQTK